MDHCDPHVARKLSWVRFQCARARMEIEATRLLVFHGSVGSVFHVFSMDDFLFDFADQKTVPRLDPASESSDH